MRATRVHPPAVDPAVVDPALPAVARDPVSPPATGAPAALVAAVAGLRQYVTVVHADEIAADPEILFGYTDAFGPERDATLVIYAPDREPASVLAEIGTTLAASGIAAEYGPDAKLLCLAADEGDAFLASRADVVLSRRPPRLALVGVPHFGPGTAGLLSAQAAGTFPPPIQPDGLAAALLETTLAASSAPDLADNVDLLRYADAMSAPAPREWPGLLTANLHLANRLESLWQRVDCASREVLVSLLAYGVLGYPKIRMNVGPFTHIQGMAREFREHMMIREQTYDPGFLNWLLDEYDLAQIGLPIRLHSHPRLLVNEFKLKQYQAPEPAVVAVRAGDVVIDGGGCWGETALHFALLAGAEGAVHTFEFVPQNVLIMRHNLALNPELAARIEVHEQALWSEPGAEVGYTPNAGGTRVSLDGAPTPGRAQTMSIDALLSSGAIDRLDFLKLDVEGSELAVLRGAESALRRYRPRLAISAYHRADDLVVLPDFIDALELGYRFAIGHFTMSTEETVLFAWCDSDVSAQPAAQ